MLRITNQWIHLYTAEKEDYHQTFTNMILTFGNSQCKTTEGFGERTVTQDNRLVGELLGHFIFSIYFTTEFHLKTIISF